MCILIAQRKQLLVPLLERLQPRESFVQSDLRHGTSSDDDDAIVVGA
jgi:hypothetical protein